MNGVRDIQSIGTGNDKQNEEDISDIFADYCHRFLFMAIFGYPLKKIKLALR